MAERDAEDRLKAERMAQELAAHGPAEFVYQPLTVLQLVGLLQLATRHPRISSDHRETARRFVAAARDYFADCPVVLDIIERGERPENDS